MYQTEGGAQVGLPFLVFPAVSYYQKEMFDEAGLNYPPAKYGDKYVMPDGSEVDWNWADRRRDRQDPDRRCQRQRRHLA